MCTTKITILDGSTMVYNVETIDSFVNHLMDYQVPIEITSGIVTKKKLASTKDLAIESNLIDTKLYNTLLKYSNNKNDVKFLYLKLLIRRRNIGALFPYLLINRYVVIMFPFVNKLDIS